MNNFGFPFYSSMKWLMHIYIQQFGNSRNFHGNEFKQEIESIFALTTTSFTLFIDFVVSSALLHISAIL